LEFAWGGYRLRAAEISTLLQVCHTEWVWLRLILSLETASSGERTVVVKGLFAAIAITVFVAAGPARAADIAVPAPVYQAVPVVATPVLTWTGVYAGLNIGGIWSSNKWTDTLLNQTIGTSNAFGGVGGGQIGFDYQFSPNWLVGIRGMFDGTGFRTSLNQGLSGAACLVVACTLSDQSETSWFATLTGRVGYLVVPTFLVYAKGGVAWIADEYSQQLVVGSLTGLPSIAQRITRTGFDAGAGFEWMFVQNWSVFVEYDYAGFGTAHFSNSVPNPIDIEQNVQVILAGFNYRFTNRY
jgi:outer membrane immunogenic protein